MAAAVAMRDRPLTPRAILVTRDDPGRQYRNEKHTYQPLNYYVGAFPKIHGVSLYSLSPALSSFTTREGLPYPCLSGDKSAVHSRTPSIKFRRIETPEMFEGTFDFRDSQACRRTDFLSDGTYLSRAAVPVIGMTNGEPFYGDFPSYMWTCPLLGDQLGYRVMVLPRPATRQCFLAHHLLLSDQDCVEQVNN